MKNEIGGLHARINKGKLWEFTDKNDGSFVAPSAEMVSRIYFPLLNRHGMKCSITPEFKGDICSDFLHYHSIPIVTEDLHRVNNSRNFWVYVEGKIPWSVTGFSAFSKADKWINETESSEVEGELGLFHLTRENKDMGLKAKTTAFVPHVEDFVEIIKVEIENTGNDIVEFFPTAAIPIYGRSADNLRDHRNVTTMFIQNYEEEHGVSIKPRINFNEFGHSNNDVYYSVLGFEDDGSAPANIIRTVKEFAGEGGSLDAPEMIFKNLSEPAVDYEQIDGFEAIGALKYKKSTLKPGEKKTYIIVNGITNNRDDVNKWGKTFGSLKNVEEYEEKTREYWQKIINEVSFETNNNEFNNWVRWVNFQLICRQVYGNSYLPDFGYGRGGRGWRDLFSDLLSIFLIDAESARTEIINNFLGIRVDGTNATIVGEKPGEFVADRNNVPRTWCDHGSWPFFVLNFYMQQTGDFDALFKEIHYWKDQLIYRSKKIDDQWDEAQGTMQKTTDGTIYKGTILEHTLLQQLCSFYNVGKHNNILLEGADWNDTYDMARNNGESVCFFNWYAHNLKSIGDVLQYLNENKGLTKVSLMDEMICLLDTLPGQKKVDYNSATAKKEHLLNYYSNVSHTTKGSKSEVNVHDLIKDLRMKSDWIYNHIRSQEWLETKEGYKFFNGHYDDNENRVHGDHPKGVRIDLTSQVLPTIFETATDEHIPELYKSVMHYLKSPKGGLHLCSNFHEDKMYFGRLTGFIFGHKEHGGIWMQQNTMFIYGLYKRGFVKEGYEVFKDVYTLCNDSATAKMFPGIPSYFEKDGRASYYYLTGSATWLILALVTQMYGIRGEAGDLCLNPKIVKEQFGDQGNTTINCNFQGKAIKLTYVNKSNKEWDEYKIGRVSLNGEAMDFSSPEKSKAIIEKGFVSDKFKDNEINELYVELQ